MISMLTSRPALALAAFAASLVLVTPHAAAQSNAASQSDGWSAYGHDAGGTRYSPLTQINRENVKNLKPVWEWRAGEKPLEQYRTTPGVFEVTPIMVDGLLFLTTPFNRVWLLKKSINRAAFHLRACRRRFSCLRSTKWWPAEPVLSAD